MRRRRRPSTPWPCNISRNAFGMATAVLRGRRVRGARALKATRSFAFASRRAVKRGVADACTCSSLLSAVVVSSMAAASSSSALPDDPANGSLTDLEARHLLLQFHAVAGQRTSKVGNLLLRVAKLVAFLLEGLSFDPRCYEV